MDVQEKELFLHLSQFINQSELVKELVYLRFKKGFSPFKGAKSTSEAKKLLIAGYFYLSSDPSLYRSTWDWRILWQLVEHKSPEIRWLSMQCIRVLCNISDKEYFDWIKGNLTEDEELKLRLDYNFIYRCGGHHSGQLIMDPKISSLIETHVVNIVGVNLVKYDHQSVSTQDKSRMIMVPSVESNLKRLAISLSENRPVLIEGPLGCGKTSLIEHISSLTGRVKPPELTKIQIGNQVDSKILIGSYCCTEVIGEFVWKPGPLTEALLKGHWLVFEDIDHASADVLTIILSIIKSKSLASVPGCFTSSASTVDPRFRLFFTRRINDGRSEAFNSADRDMIIKLCEKISIYNLDQSELAVIISERWPALVPNMSRILQIYNIVMETVELSSLDSKDLTGPLSRKASLRDFLKWCQRISTYFQHGSHQLVLNDTQRESCLLDAYDCFLASISNKNVRDIKSEAIGVQLHIAAKITSKILAERRPDIIEKRETINIGRVTLKRQRNDDPSFLGGSHPFFSKTIQSLSLLEKIACSVDHHEPVLLVGETGTGKTSTVQYLCHLLNRKLTVVNMNQQSDTCDLLGGYKPVELAVLMGPIREEFDEIFAQTFNQQENAKFLRSVALLFRHQSWTKFLDVLIHVQQNALKANSKTLREKKKEEQISLLKRWEDLGLKINKLKSNLSDVPLVFTYVEGTLVKAMRKGEWILLDEINLAESETLQCLSSILESEDENVLLIDKADGQPLKKHPNFRLFACMNPSTDIGKRDLPLGIRNRFTEFFVEELESESDLRVLVNTYLQGVFGPAIVERIVQFYLEVRRKSKESLKDAVGGNPNFTLRTLCRALQVAVSSSFTESQRALYEAFCLSFLTQLNAESYVLVEKMILKNILKRDSETIKKINMAKPESGEYILIDSYWVPKGPKNPELDQTYILTSSVRRNLKDVARIVSIGKSYPILIQGETSVGKTSMINYLARMSGNVCLRVNNHEHTDLQEYIGSYTADDQGKLVFKEGVLVEAMRKGYWIILDELNLASTEVLESLNRVLDENRELFIPETQETIKAHPKFLLFATQNPPGHYGGRKILSRAFRNRFIELHFDEIPSDELETILQRKCLLPPSYAKKMVVTLMELRSKLHQSVSLSFAGKHGGVTLRDLFRWGERYRLFAKDFSSSRFYNWDEHLANEGYMLLAGRSRNSLEENVIRETLRKIFNVKDFNPDNIFEKLFHDYFPEEKISIIPEEFKHLCWTKPLQRLAVLVFQALKYSEPVLLVGETGCGKTTICQLFAALKKKPLFSVNCHMHSESSDFLGSLRPVRDHETSNDKLFEWVDGPLVKAMQLGSVFLIDEISLADDSVLERLNSVIEPERLLLLTEKGFIGKESATHSDLVIQAHPEFHLVATMNPGGDYGKKELSPALRNRFTEIWCYSSNNLDDIEKIILHNLSDLPMNLRGNILDALKAFLQWYFAKTQESGISFTSIRDVLSLVNFISTSLKSLKGNQNFNPPDAIRHAIHLVFLDSFGSSGSIIRANVCSKKECEIQLEVILEKYFSQMAKSSSPITLTSTDNSIGIEPFFISKGHSHTLSSRNMYIFDSPTVASNAQRLLRAMQLPKPILIEGVPGVGKTSLVQSLAKVAGFEVIRINLSEQTDVSDLFGADLPVEGSEGQFSWRDGPLLQALKSDSCWVLLDELNLASQSVLEGLNACLDHRGEVFLPELGKVFTVSKERTRIFACQNPHAQGGDRKGLPKSFLNRFTVIHVESLTSADLRFIISSVFQTIPTEIINKMVAFNEKLNQEILQNVSFARRGAPWEFNLRDMFRWCQLTLASISSEVTEEVAAESMELIYTKRFRAIEDRMVVEDLFENTFNIKLRKSTLNLNILPDMIQVGQSFLSRSRNGQIGEKLMLLHHQLPAVESIMKCAEMNWMALIVGSSQSGKTSLVRLLSQLVGANLKNIIVNSEMDTIELLGGFNQKDLIQDMERIAERIEPLVWNRVGNETWKRNASTASKILKDWSNYSSESYVNGESPADFLSRLEKLLRIVEKIGQDRETKSIVESLRNLENFVKQRNSLTSRGSFQWLDSVLIDALREGDWLLIDDTNLCPASVLDRLNGLLEPGGELVLNEQGCVNGTVPVIKPHPNFRLILTMDPKNGELSRAMRNRGVEIFVLPAFNESDTKAQMVGVGLQDTFLQNILISSHQNLLETTPNLTEEQQNGSYLIRLAGQIASELKTGSGTSNVLSARSELKAIASLMPSHQEPSTSSSSLKPNLRDLRLILGDVLVSNTSLELSLLDSLSSIKSCNNFYQHDVADDDLISIVSRLELFFARSSMEDLKFRCLMVEKKLGIKFDKSLATKSPSPALLLNLPTFATSFLPTDIRVNRVLWDKCPSSLEASKLEKELNRFTINLFNWKLSLIQSYHKLRSPSSLLKQSSCSAENIGKVSTSKQEMLQHLNLVISILESQKNDALSQLEMDDQELYNFRTILLWLHAFQVLLSVECEIIEDNHPIFEKLLILWVVMFHKLKTRRGLKSNQKYDVFTTFNTLLGLEEKSLSESVSSKRQLSSTLTFYKCEQSANIFVKMLDLVRLLTSSHVFCDKPCDTRGYLNEVVGIFEKLTDTNSDLHLISMRVDQIETKVRKTFSTTVSHDMDERGDQELAETFQNSIKSITRKITPLDHLTFFWHELINFKDLGASPSLNNAMSTICISPMHTFLVKNMPHDMSLRNELFLYHLLDCNRTLSLEGLYKLFATRHSGPDNIADEDSKNEWTKPGYCFHLSPILTLISSKILATKSTLGTIDCQRNIINNLKDFLSDNFMKLCDTSYLNLLANHFDLILQLFDGIKPTILEFIARLDPSFQQQFNELLAEISRPNNNTNLMSHTMLMFGTILTHLWAPTMPIDPLQKWSLKLDHYKEELKFLQEELASYNTMSALKTGAEMVPESEHPHVVRAMERKKLVEEKIEKLESRQGYRPIPSQYQKLRYDVVHFLQTMFSIKKVFSLAKKTRELNESNKRSNKHVLNELLNLQKSVKNFINHILNSYPLYSNVTNEMLLSLNISLYGLNISSHTLLCKETKSMYQKNDDDLFAKLDTMMSLACPQPIKRTQDLVDLLRRENFKRILDQTKSGPIENSSALFKSSLAELKNAANLDARNGNILTLLFSVIDCFLQSWLVEEEERKSKMLEEISLFQYKTKTHENELPEDLQDELELKKRFPSYEQEFQDFVKSNERMDHEDIPPTETISTIQSQDIVEICMLHEEIMHLILSRNIPTSIDVIKPVVLRYRVASEIADALGPVFGRCLDQHSVEASWIVSQTFDRGISSESTGKIFNFYRDSAPGELFECYQVLDAIKTRIFEELLPQFPGNPMLHQLLLVIERLYNLNIESPLAKFVTGLEVLLRVAEDWEQIAHRKIKLVEQLAPVTQLVIKWRKMELRCWSLLLDSVHQDIEWKQISKYWFHFYSLIHSILTIEGDASEDVKKLLSLLKTFFENSTIGEFSARLKLVRNFISHQLCIDSTRSHLPLFTVLVNTHQFYQQYEPSVLEEISKLRKPIEKELKQFVKIMRWNDGNFWSIKSKVEKSHKTLYRLTKKYEKSLQEPCSIHLKVIRVEESKPLSRPIIKPPGVTEYDFGSIDCLDFQVLSKSLNLILKAQKFCRKIKINTKDFRLSVRSINDKIGEIITGIKELQGLKVPPEIKEKEKYEKEVKSINNLKRQSFSNLLKSLVECGISYKKGVELYNLFELDSILLTCKPFHEAWGLATDSTELNSTDKYFYASLFRFSEFKAALTNPSDQLKEIRNVFDRMKGIVGFLLQDISKSKNKIFSQLYAIKKLRGILLDVDPSRPTDFQLCPTESFKKWFTKLSGHLVSLKSLLHQLKELPIKTTSCGDESFPNHIQRILDSLNTIPMDFPSNDVIILQSSEQKLENAWAKVYQTSVELEGTYHDLQVSSGTVISSLAEVCQSIGQDYASFQERHHDFEPSISSDEETLIIYKKSDNLIRTVLAHIQTFFKVFSHSQGTDPKETKKPVYSEISRNAMDKINLEDINRRASDSLEYISKLLNTNDDARMQTCTKVFTRIHHFMNHYLDLAKYIMLLNLSSLRTRSKLLYLLLGLFTDVCKQGFCLPPPFQEENDKCPDNMKLKDLTDAGLGEGEGTEDVSNKVESEDQLEEALPQGAQKDQDETDEKDIKDSKDGIEMSEDFDAPDFGPDETEEREKSDDEKEDEDDSDDELDKKMGDIDDSEGLDEKMWGDDEDEDEEDEEDLDDMGQDGGEDLEEDQMVAKDDNEGIKEKSQGNDKAKKDDEENVSDTEEINEQKNDDEYEGEREDPFKKKNKTEEEKEGKEAEEFPENMELDQNEESGSEAGEESELDKEQDGEQAEKEDEGVEEPAGMQTEEMMDEANEENKDEKEGEDGVPELDEDGQTKDQESDAEDEEKSNGQENEAQEDQTMPDNRELETQEVPLDSGMKSDLKSNAQVDPLYDLDERNMNEGASEAKDQEEKQGTGSCMRSEDGQSTEGNIKSATIHEESTNSMSNTSKPQQKKRGQRSLSENPSSAAKKKKILEKMESEGESEAKNEKDIDSELVQHCQENEDSKREAIDIAEDAEAMKSRPDVQGDDLEPETVDEDQLQPEEMEVDDEKATDQSQAIKPKKSLGNSKQEKAEAKEGFGGEETDEVVDIDGEYQQTSIVPRGPDSQYFTQIPNLDETEAQISWFDKFYQRIEKSEVVGDEARKNAWNQCERTVGPLVYELCQQLQLVLEPMKASKMKGDYRTGKRLNMRKVIEYIASQYKKDKIWLRRTKPSKRQYQIILAIDDSSSMLDNESKRMAFESIALLGKSLSLMEAGELALMSFGEEVKLLHSLDEPFTDSAGSKLLSQLDFAQKRTRIAQLLNQASSYMVQSRSRRSSVGFAISQLLIIISDGRGLYNEGEALVRQSVRNIRDLGIFTVFLVMDSLANKDSILDIKVPVFDQSGNVSIESYMDKFPFPFYIILRDINNMPRVLGEALRKWFELVTASDR